MHVGFSHGSCVWVRHLAGQLDKQRWTLSCCDVMCAEPKTVSSTVFTLAWAVSSMPCFITLPSLPQSIDIIPVCNLFFWCLVCKNVSWFSLDNRTESDFFYWLTDWLLFSIKIYDRSSFIWPDRFKAWLQDRNYKNMNAWWSSVWLNRLSAWLKNLLDDCMQVAFSQAVRYLNKNWDVFVLGPL